MQSRLHKKYVESVRPALMEKNNYKNIHQVPRMEKIVINMGVSASLEKGAVEDAVKVPWMKKRSIKGAQAAY